MNTIYANIVQLKITPTELVMEFGNFFPDRPGVGPPPDFAEIRVVMNVVNLEGFANGLQQAVRTRQTQAVVPAVREGGVGFVPPGTGGGS
jgi:hypothetical protein